MHLGADCAGPRADGTIRWPELRLRGCFRQILTDGQGIPYGLTVMFQDRHLAGGGMGEDAIFKSVNIELDQFFVELDAGAAEHQPATQRPRRIIFVADDDFHD